MFRLVTFFSILIVDLYQDINATGFRIPSTERRDNVWGEIFQPRSSRTVPSTEEATILKKCNTNLIVRYLPSERVNQSIAAMVLSQIFSYKYGPRDAYKKPP